MWPTFQADSQVRGAYTVSGIVVRNKTNEPLRRVRINLAPSDQPDKQITILTPDDGKFVFTNVPQGKYILSIESHGITRSYQQDGSFSTGIATGPSLDSTNIVFPVPAPASLQVAIVDEDHDPVNSAEVILDGKFNPAGL